MMHYALNNFNLVSLKPPFFAVSNTNSLPALHRTVSDDDLSAFVQDKQVSAVLGRRALDRHCRLDDDSSRAKCQCTFLLPGKEVAQGKEQHGEQGTEETYFPNGNAIGKEIHQRQNDGSHQ